jgi:hypothetical protein
VSGDPLAPLRAFDRLEVGPVRLERRRLSAPYTVVLGRRRETTELLYRYEEDAFEPEAASDRNLASLIAAQVALNYGLFADEIVLHGPLDEADRRFLGAMAENTAREIYVKKFLEPNPFLVGEARSLPAVRRERFLRARLLFPEGVETPVRDDVWGTGAGAAGGNAPAAVRNAVLASGGKDSLLTQGLLEEIGPPPLAAFVNESGRHWFTAMNAHRHLAATRSERTARVWTSSDRVFAWMLGRLPMVRPDFARVRSDEYPVRLWTVAVFLFGVLPVLRRRGVERILIGDEFDTSRRLHHRGIPHYDGLYDQSVWFDAALTRYYGRKGWPLQQLSILRPLSELLIQGILAARYPELHACQVSCHAAHIEDGRVRPCGRCEKCRRIVGMHLALGAEPAVCGYTEEQIEACLEALARRPVHQEAAGAAHMLWLLERRGLLPGPGGKPAARAGRGGGADVPAPSEHPEVVRLRFHPDLSPAVGLPPDLREPLLRVWLEHAEGVLTRRGGRWEPVEPADLLSALRSPDRQEVGGERVDTTTDDEGTKP